MTFTADGGRLGELDLVPEGPGLARCEWLLRDPAGGPHAVTAAYPGGRSGPRWFGPSEAGAVVVVRDPPAPPPPAAEVAEVRTVREVELADGRVRRAVLDRQTF